MQHLNLSNLLHLRRDAQLIRWLTPVQAYLQPGIACVLLASADSSCLISMAWKMLWKISSSRGASVFKGACRLGMSECFNP